MKHEYTSGSCHLFAMALNKTLGYPIIALWDVEPLDDDLNELPTSLVHMCNVKPNGDLIDITGITTKDDIEDIYPFNTPEWRSHSYEDVKKLIKQKILHGYKRNEERKLIKYITNGD